MAGKSVEKYRTVFIIIAVGLFVATIAIVGMILFYPSSDKNPLARRSSDGVDDLKEGVGILFNPYEYFNATEVVDGAGVVDGTEVVDGDGAGVVDGTEVVDGAGVAGDGATVGPPRVVVRPDARAAEPATQQGTTRARAATSTATPSTAANARAATPAPARLHSQQNGTRDLPRAASVLARPALVRPVLVRPVLARPALVRPATTSAGDTTTPARTNGRAVAVARAATAAATAPRAPRVRYWIQLFSSDSYEHTESARLRLAHYQLEGGVSTHDIDGTRYYRLRVGPYYDYNEAQKFLAWFNQSDTFHDGYVVRGASN